MKKYRVGKTGIIFGGIHYQIAASELPKLVGKKVFIFPEGNKEFITLFSMKNNFLCRAVSHPTPRLTKEAVDAAFESHRRMKAYLRSQSAGSDIHVIAISKNQIDSLTKYTETLMSYAKDYLATLREISGRIKSLDR